MAWTADEQATQTAAIDAAIAELQLVKTRIAEGKTLQVLLTAQEAARLTTAALLGAAFAAGT